MVSFSTILRIVILGIVFAGAALGNEKAVDFSRDIRPILSNNCFKCHGPDAESRDSELRLDSAAGVTADLGGYHAVVPGDPDESELLTRVTTEDADLLMPPADSDLKLSAAQIALLRQWIADGASYDQHWSFRPLIVRRPPNVNRDGWPQNEIDSFVLHRLEGVDVQPSPEAPRSTLIRRLYLDLLGLPPTPAEVDAFVNDAHPGAYERLVERTLASPHFGERWGRHWLDQARYADTNGFTIDSERSIWPYRDWVIHAINQDQPFDSFTVEQIAGDLLPGATQNQRIATGFHRNTQINQEGGSDPEQFRNEAVIDRVNTTGAVWLGLTVGCCQCHNHKYDPISQREYYQLFAFFNSGQDVNSTSPTMRVATAAQQHELTQWDERIRAAEKTLAEFDRKRGDGLPPAERDDGKPIEWQVVDIATFSSESEAKIEHLADGSIVVSGPNGDTDVYTLGFSSSPLERITALRLETLTHPALPNGGPGRAVNGNFVLNEFELSAADGDALPWRHATADHSQKDYHVTQAIDRDPDTGWAINVAKGRMNVNRTAQFILAKPASPLDPSTWTVRLKFGSRPAGYNIGRLRLAVTSAGLGKFPLPDPDRERLAARVQELRTERDQYARSIPNTMVMRDLEKPRATHVLIRGDFLRRGEPVVPDTPSALPPLTADENPTRLDLANWLVDERNPLTARVTVNRVWMRCFGQGLVESENDFGIQGAPPTHAQLLDWLAAEFLRQDWSLKSLLRQIVTSATYRQSSASREKLWRFDPRNQLLARQARLRVESEIIRDLGLAVSDLLSRRIGGRSVYPPQPAGVYAFTQRKANWPTSQGADRFRRGMYTFFMRSAPYPMQTTFDAPRFDVTCTRRVRSNTPLQALTQANDQAMLEMARGLAVRLLDRAATQDQDRLAHGFTLCLSRSPKNAELERLTAYLLSQRDIYASAPQEAERLCGDLPTASHPPAEVAAWTMVARVLLNLDEFITRE